MLTIKVELIILLDNDSTP